ncbi:hypothetical protein CASFOL_027318 [Castilleja foliolosa]|uniref:Uncharacterized protein n=1 Tax=Castilleja foliolosa TaxID=1961234 RepID=A0ABD3CFC1_9LAMI
MVGTAAAYLESGYYSLERYLILLASFVLVNLWVNLSNDVYDFDTGADKNKRESVVNLFGSRTTIHCPPYRLSYHGLGEPLSFAANGPFCTVAFYLLQGTSSEQPISGTIISASILIEDDKAVGKFSPSFVRLGSENGSNVVKMSVLGLYWLVLDLGFAQTLPFSCVVPCTMTLPMGNLVVSFVEKNHKDKSKIFMAKYYCVRLHALFGVVLAVGLVASRLIHYGEQFENLLAFFDRAN